MVVAETELRLPASEVSFARFKDGVVTRWSG